MSFDTRNISAVMKRAEQLRRWEESDTNREPAVPKNEKGRRIKFSSGCVFLAACVAGDKDEVLRLLETGADINTANVDGLTALHQACIDDNLEMVEFLVEHGADINRQDNEGWTPLHATASCGFVSIARYLVENGADLTAINSDGELAIDLVTTGPMADYLQSLVDEYGIDCEKARQHEEQLMLNDAKKWLRTDASEADKPHPKTGATALHVASAKGYANVLKLLLASRANVDKQDNDGWTPLHAAAHWGQKEACELLVEAMADMDIRNYAGQTAIDVAEKKLIKFLEELRANNKRAKRRPSSQIRISDTIENHIETPTKLIRVEVKADAKDSGNEDALSSLERILESEETDSDLTDSTESSHSTSISESLEDKTKPPAEPAKPTVETVDEDAPWRRNSSIRTRNQTESPSKTQVPDKEVKSSDSEVILRRTQSFENDEKFYQKYHELRERIKANSCPILPATQTTGVLGAVNTPNSYSVQRSASLNHRHLRKPVSPPVSPSTPTTTPNTGQVRRSFVPPVRDEESETQRKAHAKRVRETRRSTQGVTLDEIKSAEELVKKKNLNNNNNNSSTSEMQNTTSSTTPTTITATTTSTLTTITTATTTTTPIVTVNDRVPSTTYISTDDKSNTDSTKSHQINEEITASYTITAPNSTKRNSIFDDSSSKVSATYTITPPTTVTVIPSISIANRDRDDKIEKDKNDLLANKMPAVNVPISNKKTENLEDLTKTASPTVLSGSFLQEKIHSEPSRTDSETLPVNPDTAHLNRIRDNRSLFDIDNANSLTLAEKLRNEANKYNEATRSNNDVTTVGLSKITDDNSENDGLLTRRCDSTPSSPLHHTSAERRPSWRLKFDAGSKFKLEDASAGVTFPPSNSTIITSAPAVIAAANSSAAQRRNITSNTTTQTPRPVSAPVISTTSSSSDNATDAQKDASSDNVTISLRRNKNSEDKENDKENDSRSAQATQAVIQRRRKPKRRSTGVVHLDMDDIDPERQDSPGDNEEKESGSEKASRSRLGSTSSLADGEQSDNKKDTSENGEVIDYKALWEAVKLENDKLKQMLKKKDDELVNTKATVEKFTSATTKNSLSELEKRERRAMERKLSEMEEELKLLQKLKTENERLRAENRALTRVVSKLTTSAQNQLHNKQ